MVHYMFITCFLTASPLLADTRPAAPAAAAAGSLAAITCSGTISWPMN